MYMYDWWDFIFMSINYPWCNTMKSTDLVEVLAWLTNQLTVPGYYHLLYDGIWNKTHRLLQVHTFITSTSNYTYMYIILFTNTLVSENKHCISVKIVMIICYQVYQSQQIIMSFHIVIGLIYDFLHVLSSLYQ